MKVNIVIICSCKLRLHEADGFYKIAMVDLEKLVVKKVDFMNIILI